MTHYDTLTLCPDYRFVRVVSREGVFYDLVRKWRSREHVFRLRGEFAAAKTLGRAFVPPCVCRDFTELDGPEHFRKAVWKNGGQFYFPLTAEDRAALEAFEAALK